MNNLYGFGGPKTINIYQVSSLNVIFHVMVSVYRLVKFETRPSSLLNLGMAYFGLVAHTYKTNSVTQIFFIAQKLSASQKETFCKLTGDKRQFQQTTKARQRL